MAESFYREDGTPTDAPELNACPSCGRYDCLSWSHGAEPYWLSEEEIEAYYAEREPMLWCDFCGLLDE